MNTILFLSGTTMNDALGAAGRAHRAMFEPFGYKFIEINLSEPGADATLGRVMQAERVEFVYGVMGMGADIGGKTADGRDINYWEGVGIPYISLKGDTPAYFFSRHVMTSPWHACLYFFPEHLEVRKRFRPTRALYGIVPPIPFDMTDKRQIDFRKKEVGKLLFLKNGNDPEKLVRTWRDGMPEPTFLALSELASELASGLDTRIGDDIDALVVAYFRTRGWDVEEFVTLRLFFVAQLDDYLRRIKSALIADVLADFPVEIHGFNWEHMDFSRRKATYVQGGDYTATRQRIVDSLAIVDMSPNTQRAPHDRAMRAFGLYTLCVTNRQSFFSENFTNADDFTYRFDREHLRARIADVLADPKGSVELGIDAAEQFRKERRPSDFAQFMIDTASHVRLACSSRPAGFQDYFVWPPARFS